MNSNIVKSIVCLPKNFIRNDFFLFWFHIELNLQSSLVSGPNVFAVVLFWEAYNVEWGYVGVAGGMIS